MTQMTNEQRAQAMRLKAEVMRRAGYTVEMVEREAAESRRILQRSDEQILAEDAQLQIAV